MREPNRYAQIIERIFLSRYQEGTQKFLLSERTSYKLPQNCKSLCRKIWEMSFIAFATGPRSRKQSRPIL